ncbi:ABC transporter permease [Rhizobium leguminosarum]|uniref:ABC transporter permease n=1 Tax=Rhizobium leguminosarum TaxID=384 RepID=UPI00144105D8|nr:ABC transporter permease [Rhizobium leguminosarum]NKL66843.1 ABC transporter permease subunit [Rhizobium leguminosarum bv. viciae]
MMKKQKADLPTQRISRLARIFHGRAIRILATRHGTLGVVILIGLALLAISVPLLAPYHPFEQTPLSLAPPSARYPFGTDNIGRDIFSLVLYGSRSSLLVGFGAATAALFVGGAIGILAGYFRGPTEAMLMRVIEVFQTLPVIMLVLCAVALFGSSFWLLIVAVALAIWPMEARLIYGQYIKLREREFVAAARVADLSTAHIIFREILPNAIQPVIVQVALDASAAILIEAGLGFLGLSDPGMVSWGQLLFVAQDYMDSAWWMSLFPGIAICITIIGLNMFADGLNEIVDPRREFGGLQ